MQEIDNIYKSKLVKENNKKYPYVVTLDLPFEVEARFDVLFKTYSVKNGADLIVLELDFESVEKPEDTYTTKIASEDVADELADSDDESEEAEEANVYMDAR